MNPYIIYDIVYTDLPRLPGCDGVDDVVCEA